MTRLFKLSFLIVIFMLFFQFCERVTAPITKQSVRQLTPQENKLVTSDNLFGIKLFKEIVKNQADQNTFISPLSISMALGMTLNGAAGDTREAMENTLELQGLSQPEINESYQSLIELLRNLDPKVVFQIANSIWYREGLDFKQDFIELNKNYFDARVEGLNFNDPNSVNTINNWVDENTNGKIKKIVNQIDPLDIMFLINAIYFKGTWTYEFDEEQTKADEFQSPAGTVDCQMMRQKNDYKYLQTENFQAVDLPYGDEKYRMTVFLPAQGIDLNTFISDLTSDTYLDWLQNFTVQNGTLELPKFELEYKVQMKDVLSALGMEIAFNPNEANFTDLYQGPQNAYISSVLHKTYVKVDEEGTEAAAATSVTIGVTSVGGGGFYMRVDRPFFFVIRENHSNSLIFMGKIIKPNWQE